MTPIPDKAEEVPSVELPPLPTPNGHHCPGYERKGFTADQMREYARSAVLADRPSRGAPAGWKLVPVEFVQGFCTLAHNYSLNAEAPDYYHGVERDAFALAYRRCGADLAKLSAMLNAAPPLASLPGEGGCDCDRPEWCKANRNCAREWIFSGASAGGEADKPQEKA
jgi:hypothetical protein